MIVIIGAGVTGLTAGYELLREGHDDFVILESAPEAGGLAGSVVDDAGFTWDHGGHVVFSHYGKFDELLLELMGDEVEHHDRGSVIYHDDALVPYPFQDHLRYLTPEQQLWALEGLVGADAHRSVEATDFGSWARRTFGNGICELFFEPYNRKVWSTQLTDMSASWIADRVSTPDWKKALRNIVTGEDTAWGPNSTFTFPSHGGTGEIWRRLAAKLHGHIVYNAQLLQVAPLSHELVFRVHGVSQRAKYETLISTMPLDKLCQITLTIPQVAIANQLRHNQVAIVGIGVRGEATVPWSWAYFPHPRTEIPFYRVTNFTKYAAANSPAGTRGYMCEISYSPSEVVDDHAFLTGWTLDGLVKTGIIAEDSEVVSQYTRVLPYAYPVPTVTRDLILGEVQPLLESHDILSRGRFGAWRYEAGNQDHSAMQGLEAARRALYGETETVVADTSL
jgi:protoporphyrinogen oxidase